VAGLVIVGVGVYRRQALGVGVEDIVVLRLSSRRLGVAVLPRVGSTLGLSTLNYF
jgi:hypothetical protein